MRRLFLIVLLLLSVAGACQQTVRLPGSSATLECYPATASKAAVVVCPGGSYCWLDYETEGVEVARWLQQNGISAYVLRYRVAGWWAWFTHYRLLFRGRRHPDPLTDAQRALDYLTVHADSLGHSPRAIGIMGFSAGGHLAMHTALEDDRVAFAAPIYPVVSMSDRSTHRRSRRALLGEYGRYKRELRDSLSLEKHVSASCPPVFLVACEDDPVVEFRNSEILDSALSANRVPHLFVHYKTGGHGFGASTTKGTSESRQWKQRFLAWFSKLDF